MKIAILSTLLALTSLNALADDVPALLITQTDGVRQYASLTSIDSIYFDANRHSLMVQPVGQEVAVSLPLSSIACMSVVEADSCPSQLRVNYEGTKAFVDNPYFLYGVGVQLEGAYVTVTNTNTETEFTSQLSGATTDGAFLYNGSYKTTLQLAGVNIVSQRGAAIDIECGKRVALELKKGTENTLVDAANGQQKAALYCKGHLEVDKAGMLTITGKTGHAIAAKEYIKLKKSDGVINILGAVKDGIHCQQYFQGNGFSVTIKNTGDDGIQAELDASATASSEEGEDTFENGSITIKGGTYNITSSTNGSTIGSDTDTAKGLNADGNMHLDGGTLVIAMTGSGGKGIRVEGLYTQGTEDGEGPLLTVSTTGSAYSSGSSSGGNTGGGGWWGGWGGPGGGGPGGGRPGETSGSDAKAIKVKGAATIYGGTTCVTTSQNGAEGLESKTGITIKGGTHYFKCYDDCINSSGIIDFAGGSTVCYSTNNDAVDSNYGRRGAITISGGNVLAYTVAGSPEEGLDCDNNSYITITGGLAVSAGGSQGGGGGWGGSSSSSQSVGSSTQAYYLGGSPSSYASGTYYTLCNTTGEPLCTYKFEGKVSNSLSLLTAPNLGKGSVSVKQGSQPPSEAANKVSNATGSDVFYIQPTVSTTGTAATVTAK